MATSTPRVVFIFLALGGAITAMRATVSDKLVRQFNKHILNPFALWAVARHPMYYGVMHRVGGHSGRSYSTPVVAKLTAYGMIIPLPYGALVPAATARVWQWMGIEQYPRLEVHQCEQADLATAA